MSSLGKSIARRLAVRLVAITSLLLVAVGAIAFWSQYNQRQRQFSESASTTADQVSAALSLPLWNFQSEVISRILDGRPHLARSACYAGQNPVSAVLRMLANLIVERVPVDLTPLFDVPRPESADLKQTGLIRVALGGAPFQPPLPPEVHAKNTEQPPVFSSAADNAVPSAGGSADSLFREFARVQKSHAEAHAARSEEHTSELQSQR